MKKQVVRNEHLRSQITRLKKELECYDRKFPIITLDNGSELRVGPNDMVHALCSIGTNNEHCLIKAIRGHQVTAYTGSGNMPQLIKSIIDGLK
jgi:hypothetical protein